jgi:hypothetical protein
MRRLAIAIFLVSSPLAAAPGLAQTRGAAPPPAPQRGQKRAPAKPPTPLTLRQVVDALSALKNSSRVEDQITKAGGVQFEASPPVLDLLKQYGASPKLLALIPVPPLPPVVTVPKAGPLTIVCEPKDCAVAVAEKYGGTTAQNRKTINDLPPGETTVEVFADGYEHVSRRVLLEENQAKEEKFSLKRSAVDRQQSASASLVKALTSLGGMDGVAELADIEGTGAMHWTNSSGQVEQWPMTFNKHIGRDITVTYKTRDGQCVATVSTTAKQDCRGNLRNGGDKIAEQGTSLFLSYQPHEVIHALLKRPLVASESDDNRLESADTSDAYVLTLGNDGLPADLLYRIGDGAPIQVRYSNYINVSRGRYPGRITIGRVNAEPVWVFVITTVRSRVGRSQ